MGMLQQAEHSGPRAAGEPVAGAGESGPGRAQTPLRRFVSLYAESRLAVVAFAVLAAIVLAALAAPWLAPQNPYDLEQLDILDARLPPGEKSGAGMTLPARSAMFCARTV